MYIAEINCHQHFRDFCLGWFYLALIKSERLLETTKRKANQKYSRRESNPGYLNGNQRYYHYTTRVHTDGIDGVYIHK